MSIQNLFIPKPLDSYFDLVRQGNYSVDLSKEECALVLKVSDYGLNSLSKDELHIASKIFFTLKCEIWP